MSSNGRHVRGNRDNWLGARPATVPQPDPIAVYRWLDGDRTIRLAVVDRWAAIDQLDRFGYSAAYVARRVGVSQRTVVRRRTQRRGVPGGAR